MLSRPNRLISLAIGLIAAGSKRFQPMCESVVSCLASTAAGLLPGWIVYWLPREKPITLLNPVWWANALFVVGMAALCCNRREIAGACGIIGLILGLALWLYCCGGLHIYLVDLWGYDPYIGFFLWLGSMGVLSSSVLPLLWPSD